MASGFTPDPFPPERLTGIGVKDPEKDQVKVIGIDEEALG